MDLRSLPRPFTRADARAAGLSRRGLDEALRLGTVTRRDHGWFEMAHRDPEPECEEWQRTIADHLERLRHELRKRPGMIASHSSAGVAGGMAVVISPDSPVELTDIDGCQRSWRGDGVIVHHADSTDTPYTVVDGIRVTVDPRTVADIARTRTLPHGVATIDDVLRSGRVSEHEILDVLDQQRRWVGRPRALVAMELKDPRRESWLESYSDVRLYQSGVPLPLVQVSIFDADRRFVARVDGLDPELGVFREADGQAKYLLDVDAHTTAEESVLGRLAAEQERHGRLEALGLRGFRWSTTQIRTEPDEVAGRWKALSQAPVPPISGYAEWQGELRPLPFAVERREIDLSKARTSRRQSRERYWF